MAPVGQPGLLGELQSAPRGMLNQKFDPPAAAGGSFGVRLGGGHFCLLPCAEPEPLWPTATVSPHEPVKNFVFVIAAWVSGIQAPPAFRDSCFRKSQSLGCQILGQIPSLLRKKLGLVSPLLIVSMLGMWFMMSVAPPSLPISKWVFSHSLHIHESLSQFLDLAHGNCSLCLHGRT